MKILFLITIIFTLAFSISAQTTDLSALSKSEGGKRVLAYFAAFNSGDEQKLKNFFLENLTAESIKQRPVEPRLEFHRQVRNDFQTFEIRKIISMNETEIKVLVQGKTGSWAEYSFGFEKEAPNKLLGWQIEQTDAPGNEEKSNKAIAFLPTRR